MRQIILYTDEDGYWIAECPSLPGCISQGETKEEAIENITDAIRAYIEALTLAGDPIPPDTMSHQIVVVAA